MIEHSETLGLGRRSRLAGSAIAAKAPVAAAIMAAACLAAAGCSAFHPAPSSGVGVLNNAPDASPSSTVAPPNPLGPPADPFTGTPADHWADGAAGIVLPAARPVGGFTTTQVEFAYETTRKMLSAANLDEKTLLGGSPTAFADLLTSQQRGMFLSGLNKVGVDKHGLPVSTRTWVMAFPPGDARLIGSVIKVHGTMHAKAVNYKGSEELDVDLDYLFAYAIEPPHRAASWMRIVDEQSGSVDFGNWVGTTSTFAPWDSFSGSAAGAQCGARDGYQHPDYPNDLAVQPSASPSGTPVDPYALGRSFGGMCETTTGT